MAAEPGATVATNASLRVTTRLAQVALGLAAFAILLPHGCVVGLTVEGLVPHPAWTEADGLESTVILGLCALAARAVRMRRHASIELFLWLVLLLACWMVPLRQHPPPEMIVHVPTVLALVACVLATFLLRLGARSLVPSGGPAGAWRDLLGGVRLTLALFIAFEAWANFTIRTEHPSLLAVGRAEEPPLPPFQTPVEGLPVVVTLASSGGNVERVTNEPFSLLLSRRLGDRASFSYSFEGGLNSSRLRRIAEEWLERPKPPAAFLLYEGFQDYNYANGLELVRRVRDVHGVTGWVFREVVRRSSLVTFLLWRFKTEDCMSQGENCTDFTTERVLAGFKENVEAIVAGAERKGTQVFAITLAMDETRVLPNGIDYIARVNAYLRALPEAHANVTLVDFRAEIDRLHANRDPRRCEPYELGLTPDTCGNQYHLSKEGHRLLAGVVEQSLRTWWSR